MKLWALKLVIILFSFLISIVAVEILLRLLTPEPENLAKLKSSELFLHENKPNATFLYEGRGEFSNTITLNSYGFRDDEFKTEKDEGVFRIAVLGDSQEEALQVALSDTWQKVMADRLSKQLGKKVETYSFGVSGYGTDQQWLTLREKVWQFNPDMVILGFSPNDVGDTYKNKLIRLEDGKIHVVTAQERQGGNKLGKFVQKTYIYNLLIKASSASEFTKRVMGKIRTKILGFPIEERFFLSDAQLVEGPFEVFASKKEPPADVVSTWELIRVLLADAKRQADEHGAQFVVTVNIPRAQVQPEHWQNIKDQYKLTDENASPFQINTVMAEVTGELSIPYYDGRVDAIEWERKSGVLHFPIDAHYNVNGNKFMGTKVADFLISKKLIK